MRAAVLTPWNCDRQVALLVICADAREAKASAATTTTAVERVLDMVSAFLIDVDDCLKMVVERQGTRSSGPKEDPLVMEAWLNWQVLTAGAWGCAL